MVVYPGCVRGVLASYGGIPRVGRVYTGLYASLGVSWWYTRVVCLPMYHLVYTRVYHPGYTIPPYLPGHMYVSATLVRKGRGSGLRDGGLPWVGGHEAHRGLHSPIE